ncbi:hypothetical protein [Oscillatoria acuminata]|uniref:Uncharacterized protein n=1 Tax=Oscillatoria acuminata PCC 6304 TaxID=56110 RepID=K9TE20_9CYAN|nr:hypothetical protein [Oscillatoria acuminata]AFY80376.1 hypothetical protein Oscil6304_0636 [Oscillatoria acuminata PCC 6304]
MFGFIKKLFGGIFSFFGGLFGSKKSGYYMELEESKGSTPATKPEAVQVEKLKPLPTEKSEPAKVTKSKTTKKKAESKPAAPAPAPAVAIATSEPAKPAPAPKREATPVMVTPRRRPGANMTSYLDMARNMQSSSR